MAGCNSCPSNGNCDKDKSSCTIENNPLNKIKKVIGVMSGKGGVGKSTVSVLLAKELNKKGFKVGILDADITGPSVPRLLNIKDERAKASSEGIIMPVTSAEGIKVISLNLLVANENEPVLWRGPVISGAVKQFWTDVLWEELDFLIIDMPPGTGDVALTVMQSIPIDGIVMVSIPQDLISMIVSKAVNMAKKMNINVLGIVENMSYIVCPDCDKKIRIYNGENTNKFLEEMDLKLLGELPMLSSICNISNDNTEDTTKDIDSVFAPITDNILKAFNEK